MASQFLQGLLGAFMGEQADRAVGDDIIEKLGFDGSRGEQELARRQIARTAEVPYTAQQSWGEIPQQYQQGPVADQRVVQQPEARQMQPAPIVDRSTEVTDGQDQQVADEGSAWSDYWDDERRAMVTLALNDMRMFPSEGIRTAMTDKLKTISANKGGKGLANELLLMAQKATTPEEKTRLTNLAKMAMSGLISREDVFSQAFKRQSAGTTINMPEDKGWWEGVNKRIGSIQDDFRERGQNARATLDAYSQLTQSLQKFGATGNLEAQVQELRVLADKWGFGGLVDQEKLGSGQEVQAMANRLVAEELRKNKGPQTDFDAMFAQSYIPGIQNQAEANKAINNYNMSTNMQNLILSEMAGKAGLMEAEGARKTMLEIDSLSRMLPGAVKRNDGTWYTFIEFFQSKEQAEKTPEERLRAWSNGYKQHLGYK